MTFEEFTTKFATEEQCREYLYQLRFPNGFVCPKCNNTKAWTVGNTLFECSKCGHQTSVIAGTIFQDTRMPLKTWFTAIWWVTTQKNGASAMGLQRVLGLKSYKAAWTWLHKIRKAMVHPNRVKLSGTVEVDETYIGGEESEGKTGRGTENKTLVVVAIELQDKKKLGRTRLEVIKDASKRSLLNFIKNNVEEGSTIVTDGWKSYVMLPEEGYGHVVHLAKKAKKSKDEDDILPHVHMIISLLKRWLLGTHQGAVNEKHMQAYLDEYVFRFNPKSSSVLSTYKKKYSIKEGFLIFDSLSCMCSLTHTNMKSILRMSSFFLVAASYYKKTIVYVPNLMRNLGLIEENPHKEVCCFIVYWSVLCFSLRLPLKNYLGNELYSLP
jgi:transposase-like protein/Zn ribbon nucleic-acid-binding protein